MHPGAYIKKSVLPPKLSVKKAADMLGVGRPALSNLLNGKASLSPEMAIRIEKAFGADRTELLEMQARYDEFESRGREDEIAVRAYAPPYQQISARQIAAWSETTNARAQLAALLRRLIHSTGVKLTGVDFPAFDNSQRKGWDGQLESGSATPWIPQGKSGWEFGCNNDARQKVKSDYETRTSAVPSEERKNTTFVFVTPTNWPGKEKWAKEKKALGEWKDVRAFDASDLEQWLEQSISAQTWLTEILEGRVQEICSLNAVWSEWAEVTAPPLSKKLFQPAVKRHEVAFKEWLTKPPSKPFVVAAESRLEALAFLACTLERLSDLPFNVFDRAIVFRSIGAFNRVAKASSTFVAIIASSKIERAMAGLHTRTHTIIVRGRNMAGGEPDVALGLLDHEGFGNALTAMGLSEHRIDQLARESGRSPTILRRRLAQVPAIKVPPWAEDHVVARKLIPLMFVGTWDSSKKADREILKYLTSRSYGEVEETLAQLIRMDDSPVWSVDKIRGVASKIDALYAVHKSITLNDIDNFIFAAEVVLLENDPALDLPEDKRWAANLYEKSREHSSALREGLCETLVLMAVHGNALFGERLGVDLEAHVDQVVRHLLTPSAASTWLSQKDDLPKYAEAAPDAFLNILEDVLKNQNPQIAALMAPADSPIFGNCPRAGLLWALELLAWKPERLLRVTLILARLCKWKIDDNWGNKPLNSLTSIFRSWMPQTAASVEERNRALETLTKRFPETGWQICIDQFDPFSTTGDYTYHPRWRSDVQGAGEVVSQREGELVQLKAIDLALSWPAHNEHTLGDLVECLEALSEQDQTRVFDLISDWNKTGPTESQKVALRERIRRYALTRCGNLRNTDARMIDRAKTAYTFLEPKSPVLRHEWLFLSQWVEESDDEIAGENLYSNDGEKRIGHLRREALQEVWEHAGLGGIKELCKSGDTAGVIGWHMAEIMNDDETRAAFLQGLISDQSEELRNKLSNCIFGFLEKLDQEERSRILSEVLDGLVHQKNDSDDLRIRLLRCAPFDSVTWQHVDKLPEDLHRRYWQEVHPCREHHDAVEIARLVDELLKVNRPRAAFRAAKRKWELVDTALLVRLLHKVGTDDSEPTGHYRLRSYDISEAFDELEKRGDVPRDELVPLEFTFLGALEHSKHGVRNLEERLSESPTLFMRMLALTFKRSDDGEDPPEWRQPNPDRRAALATTAYSLLRIASRVPGTQADGRIDLEKLKHWLDQVRTLCRDYAREEIGDQMIGQLLSHCPVDKDGVWPCEPVREAIEDIASNDIARGMNMGIRNSRGVFWRGEGSAQDLELAAKYRNWSHEIAFEYPFTSNLLKQIARSYDHDAHWWDTHASVRERLDV